MAPPTGSWDLPVRPAGPVIQVDGLGVKYSLRLTRRTSVRRRFASLLRSRRGPRQFWALRGLSLTVGSGEVLGVIGPNGAGKTTLLQTLAGIIRPDEGTVTVRGTVAGLLGSGGFDWDRSGRENITLFGAFLGIDAREIRDRTDAIVAFADIGDYIDAPVRTYSQGMRARLGYSIAATLEADVLLLDEIVSTGDEEYRARSKNRLKQMIRAARAIVLVTHDMRWIAEFCTRAAIIDHGMLVAEGPAAEVIRLYQERSAVSTLTVAPLGARVEGLERDGLATGTHHTPGPRTRVDEQVERPVFIAGVPRSGTSLMRAILSSHPQIAIPTVELPLWRHFHRRYGREDLGRTDARQRLVEEIVRHPRFMKSGLTSDPDTLLRHIEAEHTTIGFGTVLGCLLREHARGLGKPRWGNKEPLSEFHARAIFAEFPRAAMIHMVRDPRDVVVSQRARGEMSRQHIASVVDAWRRSVEVARHCERDHAGAYLAVRYEDLVSDPAGTVKRVCEVADLPYGPELLDLSRAPGRKGSNSSFDDVRSEGRVISQRGVGRHVERLSPADVWFVQWRVGDELDRWRYARRPLRLSLHDRGRVALSLLQEAGWRLLRLAGLWNIAARVLGRQPAAR